MLSERWMISAAMALVCAGLAVSSRPAFVSVVTVVTADDETLRTTLAAGCMGFVSSMGQV